ncbi:uracil-DNA glycosylase [Flexibacterium corallicola]|uniref:uracil-DNA glycosylase n=1 Tax=Flexibacterium corallicola TaxID=3037259 RepID=UPI00286EBB4F|nr:uracil-DNA glycosylase [Pseudovibrio sp. M1P-2-3]
MTQHNTIDLASLESYLEFLASAGVDCCLNEAPVDRFMEQPKQYLPVETTSISSAPRDTAAPKRTYSIPHSPPDDFDARSAAQSILQRQKAQAKKSASTNGPEQSKSVIPDSAAIEDARQRASQAQSLEELQRILGDFSGCNLKLTAKNLVFGKGSKNAKLMFIGEAPGRDEDIQGQPFVGRSGALLDRIIHAAKLNTHAIYLSNIVPWRPPGNRTPTPQETEICRPFIERQIELVDPDILVYLGAASAQTLSGTKEGIRKLRGRWFTYSRDGRERQATATYHPAYLLRTPVEKRLAWRDFLSIRARLES